MHKSFMTSGTASSEMQMAKAAAGDILILNWRGDGLPKEANKVRPCVIVEDSDLFSEEHPNVIVVPLTAAEPRRSLS